MRIAIIGAGRVGQALARRWRALGHEVALGVREPASAKSEAAAKATGGPARSVAAAAAAAEIVVLATPWANTAAAIAAAGGLAGKIVVDCTNPLAPGSRSLVLGHGDSGGEEVARRATGARVVKTLNTIDSSNMLNPRFGGESASMFLCGDDPEAKSVVGGLVAELGFDVVDAGPLRSARLLEPMALLLIGLIYERGLGPEIAFKLMRRAGGAGAAQRGGR